jgi:hypothetical protein
VTALRAELAAKDTEIETLKRALNLAMAQFGAKAEIARLTAENISANESFARIAARLTITCGDLDRPRRRNYAVQLTGSEPTADTRHRPLTLTGDRVEKVGE